MIYFTGDLERVSLLGVVDDGKAYGINSLLTQGTDILNKADKLHFGVFNDTIDISVTECRELFNIAPVYQAFKQKYKEGIINTLIAVPDLDSDEALQFKNSVKNFVESQLQPATGVTIEQLNAMFIERRSYDYLSDYFLDKMHLFNNPTLTANTPDDVKSYLKQYSMKNKIKHENVRIVDERQRVFFYATEDSVMPEYEDVVDIIEDGVESCELKYVVPKFHNYLGPYINYVKPVNVGETGDYTNGEYIKNAHVAAIMNDYRYVSLYKDQTSLYVGKEVGKQLIKVDPKYIEGDSDYDGDPIRDNEKDYYDELCKFVDMCFERDILEAPIVEWIALGLDIRKYIPDIIITSAPLGKIDATTHTSTDDKSKAFNIEKLERIGLTKDVFRELNAGSPTSNKWFSYAINVALAATRAYTSFVSIPFGYDAWDFSRNYVRGISFDEKYYAYTRGMMYKGRMKNPISIDDYNTDNENGVEFDLGDLSDEFASLYWRGAESVLKDSQSQDGVSEVEFILDTNANYNGKSPLAFKEQTLSQTVVNYCLTSGMFYAMPEALIKCLRFGNKKPKCLQLDSLNSRVNLTTAELITDLNYDNPVLHNGKKYVAVNIVTVNNTSDNVKTFLKQELNVNASNPIVIGLGLRADYNQPDGSMASTTEYFDLQTLANNEGILNDIYNFDGTNFNIPNTTFVSVSEVLNAVSRSALTKNIEPNGSIVLNIVNKYLASLDSESIAYKVISNMNKEGLNMFSFGRSLETLSNLTMYKRLHQMNQTIDVLKEQKAPKEIQNIVYANTLFLYGSVIGKSFGQATGDTLTTLNNTFKLWRETVDCSMKFDVVATGTNTLNNIESKISEVSKMLPVKSGFQIMRILKINSTTEFSFYILQNKEASKKLFVVDYADIPEAEMAKFGSFVKSKDSEASGTNINKIALMIKNVKAQKAGVTTVNVINVLFEFNNEQTKDKFINIATKLIGE